MHGLIRLRVFKRSFVRFTFSFIVLVAAASAAIIPVGFISWDVNFPGNAGQFDIANQTGPNASVLPSTTFPIATVLNLSGLTLTVDFNDSTSTTFGSYFMLAPDGQSFDGTPIPIGGINPLPIDATLTGFFSPLTIRLTTRGR